MSIDDIQNLESTIGVLSGYDIIEVGDYTNSDNSIPSSKVAFTVDDIYIMLRELKRFLDPKSIERLERLITRHIAEENAHNVTFESLATSSVNEFYKEWLQYKNRLLHSGSLNEDALKVLYSSEEFFKVVFQDVRIADTPTILAGKDASKVVSAKGIHDYVSNHDTDMDAHNRLFEFLFPGAVTEYAPTYSLIASTGIDAYLNINNDGILYMDASGIMRTGPKGFLPVDWSTGLPAYPIFGVCTNLCRYGSALTNNAFINVNTTISEQTDYQKIVPNKPVFTLACTDTATVVDHTVSYTVNKNDIPSGTVFMCVSLFVKPDSITNLSINAHNGTEDESTAYRYNLYDGSIYTNNTSNEFLTTHSANCYSTPTYTRCVYVCPVDTTNDLTVVIRPLDILDGDNVFKGSSSDKLTIFGLQIEPNMDTPSPYISTIGSIVTTQATTIEVPLVRYNKSWYNQSQSSFMISVSNNKNIRTTSGNIPARYVLDTKSSVNNGNAFSLYYPAVHDGKITAYFSKKDGSFSVSQPLDRVETDYLKCGLEFANSGHMQRTRRTLTYPSGMTDSIFTMGTSSKTYTSTFSTSDNDITVINKLCIGCSILGDKHLNGYLQEFIYYPVYASADHIDFYTKG